MTDHTADANAYMQAMPKAYSSQSEQVRKIMQDMLKEMGEF